MKYNLIKKVVVTVGLSVFVFSFSSFLVQASEIEDDSYTVGWILMDEEWYYFHEDNVMAYDEWVEDHYLDVDGKWIPEAERVEPIDLNSWMLTLVNLENPLQENYLPPLAKLENGMEFDERAITQLNEMIADARAEGLFPIICSAYRTIDRQEALYINQVYKQKRRGLDQETAEEEAKKYVAYPNTSEHNLGLAVDIVAQSYQLLNSKQEETKEMQWLIENCSNYGFILRYPKDKTEITGIVYEPWHFRYVGVEAAKEIMERGLCLEEYIIENTVVR